MTKRHLVYLWTLPIDLATWLVLLLMCALWGRRLHWAELGVWFELRPGSWPMRTWYRQWGGTCCGHGGFFRPDPPAVVPRHEAIHVEQYEVAMLAATVSAGVCVASALVGGPWAALAGGLACYASGWALKAAAGWMVAWLRGEDAYMGSAHEEAAYAMMYREAAEVEARRAANR